MFPEAQTVLLDPALAVRIGDTADSHGMQRLDHVRAHVWAGNQVLVGSTRRRKPPVDRASHPRAQMR